jgi:hypothetical protein
MEGKVSISVAHEGDCRRHSDFPQEIAGTGRDSYELTVNSEIREAEIELLGEAIG